jgi:hypothetical protein
LGTGRIATQNVKYLSFQDAQKFVRTLGIKNKKEWEIYWKKENLNYIPLNPNNTYKKEGWIGFSDFLGNGKIDQHLLVYRDFEKARKFVHSLKLKNSKQWYNYCQSNEKPQDIPSIPSNTYKDKGWKGIGDWLGNGKTEQKSIVYKEFKLAKKFVHSLKLKNCAEWYAFCKTSNKPQDIPSSPRNFYLDKGWNGMGDWLGTGRLANFDIKYRVFNEARDFVQKLGIKSNSEWINYCKNGNKPLDIPTKPHSTYLNKGWISLGDWLGTDRIASKYNVYLNYDEAKKYVHSLNLKTQKEWRDYCKSNKKPLNIPSKPERVYFKKGWSGTSEWLGSGITSTREKKFKTFIDSREFVRSLKLNKVKDWEIFRKSDNMPKDVPTNPQTTYKDKGWNGWADFLGKEETS